jgi:translocation and assembly module TamB
MKKPVFVGSLIILMLLATASIAIGWLCYTASGLRFALMQLNHIPGLEVRVEGVQGKLAGPLSIQHLEINHERVAIDIEEVAIELTPAALITGLIEIDRLTTSEVSVNIKPYNKNTQDHPINFLPHFLRISVDQVVIQHASYQQTDKKIIENGHVQGAVTLSRNRLNINNLILLAQQIEARGNVRLESKSALTLSGILKTIYRLPKDHRFFADINFSGPVTGVSPQLAIYAQIQQPQPVTVKSVLKWPDHQWQLQGELSAEKFQFDPWWERPTFSLSQVALQFNLNKAGMRYNGQLTIPEFYSAPLNIDIQSFYADHSLTVQSAKLSTSDALMQVTTQGTIAFQNEGNPSVDLQSQWRDLRWPLRATMSKAAVVSPQGVFKISGSFPYQYEVAGQVTTPYWRDGVLSVKGEINSDRLNVSRFEAASANGTFASNASLELSGTREWHINLQGSELDPSVINSRWPGHINIKATAAGQGFNRQALSDVHVHELSGTLRQQSLRGAGRIRHQTNQWSAEAVNVSWGSARLTAQGSTGDTHNLRWSLDIPTLKVFDDQYSGDVSMTGHLSGSMDAPQVSLQMQTKRFGYQGFNLQGLSITTSIDMSDQTDSALQLSAESMGFKQASLSKIKLIGEGRTAKHSLSLKSELEVPAISDNVPLEIQLQGGKDNSVWRGMLSRLQIADARLQSPSLLLLSTHQAQLGLSCLQAGSGHLCAEGQWQRDELGRTQWLATGQVESLPITLQNAALINGAHLQTKLNAQFAFKALPDSPWQGTADIQMQDAGIHYRSVSGRDEVLPIKLGEMHVQADDKSIQSNGELRISEQTVSTLNARLDRNNELSLSKSPLSGLLTLSSSDAKLIPVFVPEVDRANGTLAAALQLSGTPAAPQVNGIMRLLEGELDFYRLNLGLRDINFNAQVSTDQLQFTAKANAGEGLLNSTGQLQWQDAQLSGQLQLNGDRLLLADLPEYRVLASPDLRFEFKDKQVKVTGSLLIPEAKIQPKEITGAVQVSSDARYKNEAILENKQTGWVVDSQTRIKLGDKVSVDALGLSGRLSGEVLTRLRTNEKAEGTGELNINEGSYEIYGQKLTIKRGQLLYDNTLLSDPGLNIQAERTIETRTVGVNVRGLLREPRFQFYSTPAMSQTQALSYLLVGKPIDELQSGESAKVGSASNTLAIQGGGFLASQVGRRIGIEQVEMQTDTNNQSSLVLGKFLSPRLFVSYGISLTQAINTLKLRYTLGEHWSLKSELGAAKGGDLEFKIDR